MSTPEKQYLLPWLIIELDKNTERNTEIASWVNKEQWEFQIPWKRFNKNMDPTELGIIYKWYAVKHGEGKENVGEDAGKMKNRFRNALKSKVDENKLQLLSDKNGFRVYRIIDREITTQAYSVEHKSADLASTGMIEEWKTSPQMEEIRSEMCDIVNMELSCDVTVEAYGRENCRLSGIDWPPTGYVFQYMAENKGKKKLNIHLLDEQELWTRKDLYHHLRHMLPRDAVEQVNSIASVDINKSERLPTLRLKNNKRWNECFSPGILFEMDEKMNIYLTRLCPLRVFCRDMSTNKWRKLEMLYDASLYASSDTGGRKYKVFDYETFLSRNTNYRQWVLSGKNNDEPKVLRAFPSFLVVVGTDPDDLNIEMEGISRHCDLYFKITHGPAARQFQAMIDTINGISPPSNVSEEALISAEQREKQIRDRHEEIDRKNRERFFAPNPKRRAVMDSYFTDTGGVITQAVREAMLFNDSGYDSGSPSPFHQQLYLP